MRKTTSEDKRNMTRCLFRKCFSVVLPAVLAIFTVLMSTFSLARVEENETASNLLSGIGWKRLWNWSPPSAEAASEMHVKAHLVSESKTIKPGKEFLLGVAFEIEPGWHIYYKDCGEAGMPTNIDWKLPPGFTHGDLLWEKPHKFVDSGITTYGYADKTFIATRVMAPANLPKDKPVKIDAVLTWLSCKEVCVPGKATITFDVPVSDAEPDKANAAQFANVGFKGPVTSLPAEDGHDATSVASADGPTSSGPTGEATSSAGKSGTAGGAAAGTTDAILDEIFGKKGESAPAEGVLYYLGFALLGGLILNVMPCVLPVIAIKVMSFIEQADEEPARVRLLGLTFSAGIIASFLALAAIVLGIRAAGQSVGWGFQFQYPGFVILMSTIVLLLSLSLFGLFYVSFNAGQDGLDKLASREGFVGTFFKGVLATTLSTPCTAPFLGTALGFAFAQPDWVVLGIFFMSGLGMSLPYLLFTAFPSLMKFCPKPGVWMEKFKESMGFVLLATVVWLLFVLGQQVGPEGQMWASYFLLTVALASWIVSRYTDLTSTQERKIKVWTIAGVLAGAGAYFFLFNQPSIALSFGGVTSKSPDLSAETTEGLDWKPFSISALKDTVGQNKTIFLDFTADWCLTCKSNEKLILNTTEVINKLRDLKVETMKADWTTQDPDISKILNRFGRSGVPLYVVIPAGRPKDHIVLPEVINQQMVLDALEKAGPSK
jgi:thiol:disulfide interchange protein DsbD